MVRAIFKITSFSVTAYLLVLAGMLSADTAAALCAGFTAAVCVEMMT